MEVYKVLGLELKEGEYQGNKYSNMNFYCQVSAEQSPKMKGVRVDIIKLKSALYAGDIDIGDDVNFYYDKHGRVSGYEIR